MKMMFVVALALVAAAAAAPQGSPAPVSASASASVGAPDAAKKEVQILRSEFDQQPEGGYVYSFETSDGSQRAETGELKEVVDEENKPHSVVVVRGSYSYTDSDGNVQTVTYTADENGFHPEGDSIPKARR